MWLLQQGWAQTPHLAPRLHLLAQELHQGLVAVGGFAPGTSHTASLLCETGSQPVLHGELFIPVLTLQSCSLSIAKVEGL